MKTTELNSRQSNNNLYVALSIVVVILILGVSLFAITKNRDDRRNEQRSAQIKEDEKQTEFEQEKEKEALRNSSTNTESSKTLDLESLAGIYIGKNASILTNALVFPTSRMEINQDNNFEFEASGLDLSLLGLETLKVDGEFPKVSVIVNGNLALAKDNTSYDFISTKLNVDFKVKDASVDTAIKTKLIQALTQLNLVIPTVTEQKPAILNTDIDILDDDISVISTKNSTFVVNFKGTKKST